MDTSHTPSPADARALLDRAEATGRQAAGFSFAWLCYIALCAGGAVAATGLAYATATDTSPLPAWIAGGLWVFIGVALVAAATVSSPPTRRGFGSRWNTMMVVWVILWVIVAFLHGCFSPGHGIALSSAFLAAAVLGPLWEICAMRKAAQ